MVNEYRLKSIFPLGTVGWMPNDSRHTTCYLLTSETAAVFLDMGTGVVRLFHPHLRTLVDKADRIFVLLSHFHLDHIIGIAYLPLFFRSKRVQIVGPGPTISGYKTEEILASLFRSPVFSLPLSEFPMKLSFGDFVVGRNELDSGFAVDISPQEHADPSVAIKLGDGQVVFATDTACQERTEKFASGADILIHESYFDVEDYEALSSDNNRRLTLAAHSHVREVGWLAKRAHVRRLLLTHFNPEYSEERLRRMENDCRRIFSDAAVPIEGSEIPI